MCKKILQHPNWMYSEILNRNSVSLYDWYKKITNSINYCPLFSKFFHLTEVIFWNSVGWPNSELNLSYGKNLTDSLYKWYMPTRTGIIWQYIPKFSVKFLWTILQKLLSLTFNVAGKKIVVGIHFDSCEYSPNLFGFMDTHF